MKQLRAGDIQPPPSADVRDYGGYRAHDLEARGFEDVMRPVDPDVVDVVLAVAQQYDTVDDGARVRSQRSFGRQFAAVPLTIVPWP